jgi:hypothetical protein
VVFPSKDSYQAGRLTPALLTLADVRDHLFNFISQAQAREQRPQIRFGRMPLHYD